MTDAEITYFNSGYATITAPATICGESTACSSAVTSYATTYTEQPPMQQYVLYSQFDTFLWCVGIVACLVAIIAIGVFVCDFIATAWHDHDRLSDIDDMRLKHEAAIKALQAQKPSRKSRA